MRCLVGCKQSNKLYKKNYQTLQNWHNTNPPLFFRCALPQLCDSVRPMVHYGVSTFQEWKNQGQPIGTLLEELREGRLTPSGIPWLVAH